MDIELIKSNKGFYEIWADRQFVQEIKRKPQEVASSYEARAEKEYEDYINRMKQIKDKSAKTIRKTSI